MSPAMRHIKYEITIEYRKEVICMGLLDAIFGNNQPPKINSILPTAAKNEIRAGRLPILNTDSLFLKRGEKIHYIDIDIPIWKRYLLSVTEAAQFYHIGEKRLRQTVDIHPNGEFYLLVGNKVLFKKEQFEQFLAESTAI